jgi:hypothetical protein
LSRSHDLFPSSYSNAQVVGRREDIQLGTSNLVGWGLAKRFILQLLPTGTVQNLLPIPVNIILWPSDQIKTHEVSLDPGQKVNLPAWVPGVSSLAFVLPDYLGAKWECKKRFDAHPPTKTTLVLTPELVVAPANASSIGVTLGVHTKQKIIGSKIFQLFSPFWMINKTGKLLTYRVSNTEPYVVGSDWPMVTNRVGFMVSTVHTLH